MRDITVEEVHGDHGPEWWVYEGEEPIAKFFASGRDAHDFADLKKLEA